MLSPHSLHDLLHPRERTRTPFRLILQMASRLVEDDPSALVDLARVLGRTVQWEWIAQVVTPAEGSFPYPLDPDRVLFDRRLPVTPDGRGWSALLVKRAESRAVQLATDIVLPWPWSRTSFRRCLTAIGTGRSAGAWRQDSHHRVQWWEPIGIGWVSGGNHSLAAGILRGEGSLVVDAVYSMREIYEHVVCDGAFYRRRADNSPISRVRHATFAGIFEIGRLLLAYEAAPTTRPQL